MFIANAKSNFRYIFDYFMEFFGFSGKIVVFPIQSSSGKLVICYTNGTVISYSKSICIFTVVLIPYIYSILDACLPVSIHLTSDVAWSR